MSRVDVTGAFLGPTTTSDELLKEISKHGWSVAKVGFDRNRDEWVAKGKSDFHEVERSGPDEQTALMNLLMYVMRKEFGRTSAQWRAGMWNQGWQSQLPDIAQAYSQAPAYDPKAASAFMELAQDSQARAAMIGQQVQVEVVNDPTPYKTLDDMCKDLREKHRLKVSAAYPEHPLWSTDQVLAFRTVHNVLGHCIAGGEFDWPGENRAVQAHMPFLTPTAQQALFSEVIGHSAHHTYFNQPGPKKIALLNDFLDQDTENPSGHTGVHPTYTIAPGAMPSYQARLGATVSDPNANWSSGTTPLPNNAFLAYGDPLEAQATLDNAAKVDTGWSKLTKEDGSPDVDRMKQAIVNAFRVVLLSPRKDLRWNAIHFQDIAGVPADENDPKAYWDTLEHHRRSWNSARGRVEDAHLVYWKPLQEFYQYVKALHPDLDDEQVRARADEEVWHMRMENEQRIEADGKRLNTDELERKVDQAIAKQLQMIVRPKAGDADMPESGPKGEQLFTSSLKEDIHESIDYGEGYVNHKEKKVQIVLGDADDGDLYDRVKEQAERDYPGYEIAVSAEGMDFDVHPIKPGSKYRDRDYTKLSPGWEKFAEAEQPYSWYWNRYAAGGQYDLFTGQDAGLYAGWMGSHLKAISQISQHVDEILDAAQEDVHEHDGAGHHFRTKILGLGIAGVGPKVASFAWLLLQPLTSQIATIDTHMMDVLGHHYEKDMNDRDYFKYERELAAGRDSSGYSHVPLGAFQWGLWDYKRGGPGAHQDHSAMRPLDPVPHSDIDWVQKTVPLRLKGQDWAAQAPEWWQATQPARDQVAQDWDTNVAPDFARNSFPFQVESATEVPDETNEIHCGIFIPPEVREKIDFWAQQLPWPENHVIEDPEEYHITVFFAPEGHSQENREWLQSFDVSGFPIRASGIEVFPSTENALDAVVLRLDAPELSEWTEWVLDEAEKRGIPVGRFEGGNKPHITIGQADDFPEVDPPDLFFRGGPLYVSDPRDFEPLKKYAYGYKGFPYWWAKYVPVRIEHAKILGEYANSEGLSLKALKSFLDKHEEDIQGDTDRVKDAIITKFDHIHKTSESAFSTAIPWVHFNHHVIPGVPGQSMMGLMTSTFGRSTPELWASNGEGRPFGLYHKGNPIFWEGEEAPYADEIKEQLAALP